ncbi:hypothetical protein K466DRAFT_579069 [Polyporus arcularius HHB13444]|uniref:DUF4218 domain-containing protein n=1 Tax=Polyporus arcularius HHB13444 TaxID=1314778 RepID=A0A5C3NV89_9APHY|nr:hypothetical protein K466DRAFT_579069 [Polyporus arcularius HHB13444]
MHNLFLGDLRHHCREFWGIDIKDKSSDFSKVTPHSPADQATWLQNVATYLKDEAEKKLNRVRKGYLAAVAELNGAVPPEAGFTKQDYINALLTWVRMIYSITSHASGANINLQWRANRGIEIRLPPVYEESTRDFHLRRDRYDISKFRILDHDTLASVRADILNTVVPSWMQRVPKNFGSPSHGKLKADQWRTACLVNLVITLVRLWGVPTATPRQKMLLENFLDLVRAADLATRRTMDVARAEKFDTYMMRYLSGLVDTFKHPLVPNHHLSLHLRECLELFGPVHAWWAFPFERFNGILQHLNTNSRTNDMPLTFIRYWYIGANLRWLMATVQWPDAPYFKEMMDAYKKTFRDAARSNPRLASFRPTGPDPAVDIVFSEEIATDLPRNIYRALLTRVTALCGPLFSSVFDLRDNRPGLPTAVNQVPSFDHGGIKYGAKTRQIRNSFILFNAPGSPSPRAGQIREIFTHLRVENGKRVVEPFFVVDEYVELEQRHAGLDPFRQFEDLETRLCYNKFAAAPRVLALQDIQAHFAALTYTPPEIGSECIVVRSLDRVSSSFLCPVVRD